MEFKKPQRPAGAGVPVHVLRQADPANVQPLPGLPVGLFFYCEGCQCVRDGQPVKWFRSRPVCSPRCFDRLAKADELATEHVDPLTWGDILIAVVVVAAAGWGGMTL